MRLPDWSYYFGSFILAVLRIDSRTDRLPIEKSGEYIVLLIDLVRHSY